MIPHYNDTERLDRCLGALAPQVEGQPVEVLVVDNGSTQDLAPLIAAYPFARFVTEPSKGAAPARNRGVAESTAPWLFFLDADCVPAADWLRTALAIGGVEGILGGQVTLFDETPAPRSGAEAFETVFGFPQQDYVERKGFSVTANLLTTRSVFEAVGPFDGTLAEDIDWCRRAGRAGYPIAYRPELEVAHPTRSDWPALRKKWRRIAHEGYIFHGTAPGQRLSWALRGLAMPLSALVHLPRVLTSPRLASSAERRAGAWILLRLRLLRMGWMLSQAAGFRSGRGR
ncbi:GT2 family glycosyltransferase [Pseudoroseicyclus aestuarii]|uniref:GT2 family glycosyltransferase n=1 Tax=Pseudoroseicyclus aestuarii TaxID=1795041 RepID=A0A318SSU6_9RHOB|nr:GT2 family glycosyltransferase [Pseudoroseicyclus aestuarii]